MSPSKPITCDCKESVFEGLPCRHELCIYFKEMLSICQLNFNKRWTLSFFNQEDLPQILDPEDSDEYEGENEVMAESEDENEMLDESQEISNEDLTEEEGSENSSDPGCHLSVDFSVSQDSPIFSEVEEDDYIVKLFYSLIGFNR